MCKKCKETNGELLLEILKDVKKQIKIDEQLIPVTIPFCLDEDDNLFNEDEIPIINNENDDSDIFYEIGVHCREINSIGAVFVMEGCCRHVKEDEKEYFLDNLDTECPSLYPKYMRENFILLHYIDFLDIDNIIGLMCKFKVNSKNNFEFEKVKILTSKESKEFLGNSIYNIVTGWYDCDENLEEDDE